MIYFLPNPPNTPNSWVWLDFHGSDAADFLQRLTTANLKRLTMGTGVPACLLSGVGRIHAWFWIWRLEQEVFGIELDAGPNDTHLKQFLNTVEHFTFAERYTLTQVQGLDPAWIFPLDGDASRLWPETFGPGQTLAIDEEIRLCHHGARDFGRSWITAWARPARLRQWLDHSGLGETITHDALERWRIEALRPRAGIEFQPGDEAALPLELGLDDAIARGKGCYPGQEVIERIFTYGAPPRRLVRIEGAPTAQGPLALRSGAPIYNVSEPPTEVGVVTSVSSSESPLTALALVRKIHAKVGLPVRWGPSPAEEGHITAVAPYGEDEEAPK